MKTSVTPNNFGELLTSHQFARIYAATSPEFQSLVSFSEFTQLATPFIEESRQLQLAFTTSIQGLTQQLWVDSSTKRAVSVYFDDQHTIQSLLLAPVISYPLTDQTFSETEFILPFHEEWFTFWGGTNEYINYHYTYPNQRYAYDFVKTKNGFSYTANGTANEDYLAFNQEVIAPASGVVREIVSDLPDNQPGIMDAMNPAGNYVILDYGQSEYSFLAHFKKDSICVHVGDYIEQGQLLGRCGNSGNSSEPHIHFHVMNAPHYTKSKSIRINFQASVDPIRGQDVSNTTASDKSTSTIDKAETTYTVGELLLLIPKVIGQFFK